MNILIVESSSKAKTISKYLDNNFEVLASVGHVRALPSKQGSVLVGKKILRWFMKKQKMWKKGSIKQIEKLTPKAKSIYLATDPDREGEAIAWHMVELLKKNLN